ncbi:Major facilitator superfamily transporter [Pleurostoma richardsiae]|uniref:Major facilitator superfamily transporter n=1 Tax=Pleurostoma richardsiae TaxID=41990 RepID=A0AA38RED0_9PEZI|nr:Major facilitator superfamily transporter [Pleurostoma richardsiae]
MEKHDDPPETSGIPPRQSSEYGQVIGDTELSRAQARRLLLKADLIIMPLIVVSMTLAFLDKNGLGYAAVFGLKDDTQLRDQEYSWLGSIFYFGYLAMELPTLWLVDRWYRREEQLLRTAFWYNTFAGVFGGVLSYAIGKINGPLATWKYIFIIYGAVAIFVGFIVLAALLDSPSNAWFFNQEERKLAVLRLASNQTGLDAHKILETSYDPKCYCIWLCVFGYAIANAEITNFNPLIISGYGFSQTKTVLMATPQAAVAMVAGTVLTSISLFVPNVRCAFSIIASLIGLAGAVMVHSLDIAASRDASLAGVYLMGFYNVPWVFMVSLLSSNVAGATKKSFMAVSVAAIYGTNRPFRPYTSGVV